MDAARKCFVRRLLVLLLATLGVQGAQLPQASLGAGKLIEVPVSRLQRDLKLVDGRWKAAQHNIRLRQRPMLLERLTQRCEALCLELIEVRVGTSVLERVRDELQRLLRPLVVQQNSRVVIADRSVAREAFYGCGVELKCATRVA